MWPLKPKPEPHLVAGWHGWHLYELAPGHYNATDGRRHVTLNGSRDEALVQLISRCKEEGRAP
jgi:hypothetical protein